MNNLFKNRAVAFLSVLSLCSYAVTSKSTTKMYTEVTNKPTNIVSFSSNTKTTNNFNYQRSKSTTAIVGHTFQYLLGSETDPKLASFDNDAFSLKLSLNLQFISATRVKVYMRPIMKKNQLTAIVGGDSYSSSFNSALKSMTDECKAKDETVSYTYKNDIVKLKSNIVGDRTLKVINNGKSLTEDKFTFNRVK